MWISQKLNCTIWYQSGRPHATYPTHHTFGRLPFHHRRLSEKHVTTPLLRAQHVTASPPPLAQHATHLILLRVQEQALTHHRAHPSHAAARFVHHPLLARQTTLHTFTKHILLWQQLALPFWIQLHRLEQSFDSFIHSPLRRLFHSPSSSPVTLSWHKTILAPLLHVLAQLSDQSTTLFYLLYQPRLRDTLTSDILHHCKETHRVESY